MTARRKKSTTYCDVDPMTINGNRKNDGVAPMAVVFGRPGSGKTTISEAALKIAGRQSKDLSCIGLDLDVCVPQWMKDNFSQGIYPTLDQRTDFAISACDYVDSCLLEGRDVSGPNGDCSNAQRRQQLATIISFSFVNTDLRDIFRSRFPHAVWLLVDTDEIEASCRINQREGHFYKGKLTSSETFNITDSSTQRAEVKSANDADASTTATTKDDPENSEWNFAPVPFYHRILDGNTLIEKNARALLEELEYDGNKIDFKV